MRKKTRDDVIRRILDLAARGDMTRTAIAAEVGVSRPTVSHYCKKHGMEMQGGDAEERHRRVAELTRQGLSAAAIADILKVNIRTVVRDRKDVGVAQPPPRRLSQEEIATAERLLADGASMDEAARSIGRASGVLNNNPRFRGRAWTLQQSIEFAAACRRLGHCG